MAANGTAFRLRLLSLRGILSLLLVTTSFTRVPPVGCISGRHALAHAYAQPAREAGESHDRQQPSKGFLPSRRTGGILPRRHAGPQAARSLREREHPRALEATGGAPRREDPPPSASGFSEVVLATAAAGGADEQGADYPASLIRGSEALGEGIAGEGLSVLFLHPSAALATITSSSSITSRSSSTSITSNSGNGSELFGWGPEWLSLLPRGSNAAETDSGAAERAGAAGGNRSPARRLGRLLVLDCTARLLPCPQLATCHAVSLVDLVRGLVGRRRDNSSSSSSSSDKGGETGNRSGGSWDPTGEAARLEVGNIGACGSPGFTPAGLRDASSGMSSSSSSSDNSSSTAPGSDSVPGSSSSAWEGATSPYDDTPLISRLSSASLAHSCPPDTEDNEVWLTATRVVPSHCPTRLGLPEEEYCRGRSNCWGFLSLPEFLDRGLSPPAQERAVGDDEGQVGWQGPSAWLEALRGSEEREWGGEVFVIRDVFVDRRGRAFNATHLFHAGRCSDTRQEVSEKRAVGCLTAWREEGGGSNSGLEMA